MVKSMTHKKDDLPAMPFYFGDWRKAGEIRALDLDVRMIWFEMLGFMWESTERGYLTLNGNSVSHSVISKMIGVDITTFERALKQMEEFNVFSRREDGAIYCRKMVRDEQIRRSKSNAGVKGMNKRYKSNNSGSVITGVITKGITNTENENEIEIEYKSVCLYNFDLIEQKLSSSGQIAKYSSLTNGKLSEKQIRNYIKQFVSQQKAKDNYGKTAYQYNEYFVNWLMIQLEKNKQTGTPERKMDKAIGKL